MLKLLSRAREGREAIKTLKTTIWEGLAVTAFVAVMPVVMVIYG